MKFNQLIILVLVCAFSAPTYAQKRKTKKKKDPATEEKASAYKDIDEETKGKVKFDGFFTIYQDSTDGQLQCR